jgi:inhibitor of cysteine peptidase
MNLHGRRVPGFALGADPQPKVYDQTTKSIDARPGESFLVALPGNMTTGYEWRADAPAGVITVAKPTYAADPHPAGSAGYGGTYTFAVTAIAPGSTTLHFVYVRAWETAPVPANELSMQIVVSDGAAPPVRHRQWARVLVPASILALVGIGGVWYVTK